MDSIVQIEIMIQSLLQHLLNRRSMVFYVSKRDHASAAVITS